MISQPASPSAPQITHLQPRLKQIKNNRDSMADIIIKMKSQSSNQAQQQQRQKLEEQQRQDDQNREEVCSDEEDGEGDGKWKKIEKPEKQIKLYMIDFNQCDGKKCSGRKMERFNMLKTIKDKDKKKKFRGVVLSAFGEKPVSHEDLDICLKHGICVIDCSWNRIEETNQFRFKNQRILPYVVAGNPVNYGKPFQLSCVQALATALCTIDYVPQAQYIMSKFGWADGFWSINTKIKDYAKCRNLQDLEKMSQQIEQSENTMKQRSYDISDESSQSDRDSSEQQEDANQEEGNEQGEKQNEKKLQELKL